MIAVRFVGVGKAAQVTDVQKPSPGPRGVGLALDCVGVQPTVDLGAKLLGRNSVWTIVGLGRWRPRLPPRQHALRLLLEHSLLGIARRTDGGDRDGARGTNPAETTEFPLDQAVEVYDKLKSGQIRGRAVLVPDGA